MFLKSKERTKNDEFPDHTYNDMTDDNITIWKNQGIEKVNLKEGKLKEKMNFKEELKKISQNSDSTFYQKWLFSQNSLLNYEKRCYLILFKETIWNN